MFRRLLPFRAGAAAPGGTLPQAVGSAGPGVFGLIGEPGTGKSTSLQRLVRRLSQRGQRAFGRRRLLPLYVHLGELGRDLPPGVVPTAADIRAYVIEQAASSGDQPSAQIAADLDAWFDWGLRERRWLLLLDAFDELPALLERTASARTVVAYANAINAFSRDCQGLTTLVSTRPLPGLEEVNWTRWHLQPLNLREQRRVLSAWFPGRATGCRLLPAWLPRCSASRQVQREFDAQDALPATALTNPLYLTLIAAFRADPANGGALPRSLRAAFAGFVQRRLTRVADLYPDAPDADTLERAAARLALRMLTDQGRLVAHDQDSLTDALLDAGWDLDLAPTDAERWLYQAKLVRIAGTGTARQRRFEFLHRRVLEHFALRAVLETLPDLPTQPTGDPRAPVSLAELMAAELWCDVAVGVLTSPNGPGRDRFIAAVRAQLQTLAAGLPADLALVGPDGSTPAGLLDAQERRLAATDTPEVPFVWPAEVRQILRVLQRAGEIAGVSDVPTALVADRVLFAAWLYGGDPDRAEVLGLARAGSDLGMAELLAAGFRADNWLCSCRSFEQTMRLPVLPEALIAPVREALVARWLTQTLEPGGLMAMRRRLIRLDSSHGLVKALRLVRCFGRIDTFWYRSVLWLILVAWALFHLQTHMGSRAELFDALGALAVVAGLAFGPLVLYGTPSETTNNKTKIDSFYCGLSNAADCVWRKWLLRIIVARGLHVLWFLVMFLVMRHGISGSGAAGEPPILSPVQTGEALLVLGAPWLWALLGLIWGFCAPLAAMSGRLIDPWKWPLLPLLPLLLAPQWFKRKARKARGRRRRGLEPRFLILVRGGIAYLGVQTIFAPWLPWLRRPEGTGPDFSFWSDWVLLSTVLVGMTLLVLELRALLPALLAFLSWGPITAGMLLDLGARRYGIQGERGRHRALTWGLNNRRLQADQGAVARVDGAIQAIERDARRRAHQPRRWSPLAWWRAARSEPDAAWPEDVKTWYRRYTRRGSGVAYLDGVVLHDLIQLRDSLRARLAADGA